MPGCFGLEDDSILVYFHIWIYVMHLNLIRREDSMPDIVIEQSTFERLQRHARPLVDTTDAVVNRALDALEHREGSTACGESAGIAERSIDPRRLPNLTHTRVLDASLDGESIAKPNWNRLLDQALVLAKERLGARGKLMKLCPARIVRGRKEDEGYHYLAEINVSVQGLNANGACEALVATVQGLEIALEVGFRWRPMEGAAYPGERARLRV